MVEVFFVGAKADTVLARKDAPGDLLVRGMHYSDGSWVIEQEDRLWFPLMDFSRFFRGEELSLEDLVRLNHWEVSLGAPGTIDPILPRVWSYQFKFELGAVTVPVGSFGNCCKVGRYTENPWIEDTNVRMWFAPEVGLIEVDYSILKTHWVLKEAMVAGIYYPQIAVEEATWGQVKGRYQQRKPAD